MESNVQFVGVNMPEVNSLTLHVMAAVAEKEAAHISIRTRNALAARKARGLPLGTPSNFTDAARLKAQESNRSAAVAANMQAASLASMLLTQGLSLAAFSARLSDQGFRSGRRPRRCPGVNRRWAGRCQARQCVPEGPTCLSMERSRR